MRKIFLLVFLLIFAGIVFAQAPVKKAKQLSKREQEIAKIDYELEDDTVIELLRKWDSDMRRSFKDNEPLHALKYFSYVNAMKKWEKYPWFIADTGLSRKWIMSVKKLLSYMCKTQIYLDAEKFNKRTKTQQYQKTLKYFNTAYERFAKLIKKPVKVSSKSQRKAKAKKVMWQKAMRKKYKIKEKMKEEF